MRGRSDTRTAIHDDAVRGKMMSAFLRRIIFIYVVTSMVHLAQTCDVQDDSSRLLASVENFTECGMPSPTEEQKLILGEALYEWTLENEHRDLSVASFDVPVYWHVLQFNETYGTLNRSTIVDGYMPTLNSAFQGTPFTFVLQGIDSVVNPQYFNCTPTIKNVHQAMHRGSSNALNIYACNTYAAGYSGWAYLPAIVKTSPTYMDSVFVMNADVSKAYESNYYTLVHEVGHWLGLFHVFEGGCSPGLRNSYSGYYSIAGDGVDDTPAQDLPTTRRAGASSCWRLTPPINSCPDNIVGVDPGNDPVNNFMDYGTGQCRKNFGYFSPRQIERMMAQWETFRYSPDQIPPLAPSASPSSTPTLSISPSVSPSSPPSARPTLYAAEVIIYSRKCATRVTNRCGACGTTTCINRTIKRCQKPAEMYLTQFYERLNLLLVRLCARSVRLSGTG